MAGLLSEAGQGEWSESVQEKLPGMVARRLRAHGFHSVTEGFHSETRIQEHGTDIRLSRSPSASGEQDEAEGLLSEAGHGG